MSTETQEISPPNHSARPRGWTAGFFVFGALLSAIGSLLIVWNYHLAGNSVLIGLHFLGLNAGYVLASTVAQRTIGRTSARALALTGCGGAALSLLALGLAAPPVDAGWRILILAVMGMSAGLLGTALLFAGAQECARSLGANASRCGVLFGLGCLTATAAVGLTFVADLHRFATAALAVIPAGYLVLVLVNRWPVSRPSSQEAAVASSEPRVVAALLFTLVLFFQFGNEWALAGWLPLFLIHTLGSSPGAAVFALVLFFAVLLTGRILAERLTPFLSPRKLLLASIAVAIAGYLLLSLSDRLADAYTGIILTGLGFGPVYPLIARHLDQRFAYQPRFYNRILSIAVTGAMGAPWVLGYIDAWMGIRYVLLIPALGSIAVMLLALLLMLEAHLMGTPALAVHAEE